MKAPSRYWFLFGAALVIFVPRTSVVAQSVKKPSRENIVAYDQTRPGISDIVAVVDGLDLLGDGRARVTFAELKERDQPQVKRGGRRIVWNYTAPGRPVPVIKGMQVVLGVDTKGDVIDVYSEISLEAYRSERGGNLEVVAKPTKLYGDGSHRMHLRPHWIGIFESDAAFAMVWSREFGLMFTLFFAGGGHAEVENLTGIQKGIPVGNEPGFSYLPGREGWKPVPPFHSSNGPKIPPQQEIWAAG